MVNQVSDTNISLIIVTMVFAVFLVGGLFVIPVIEKANAQTSEQTEKLKEGITVVLKMQQLLRDHETMINFCTAMMGVDVETYIDGCTNYVKEINQALGGVIGKYRSQQ